MAKNNRSRRGRGEGSIYQRESDNRWCANISVGYADDGRRRRRTVYGATKREVQERLRTIASESAAGRPLETQKLTLGDYLDRWLRTIKQSVAPATHSRYAVTVKHQLKPYLGGVRLSSLEPTHVEQLYLTLNEAGCSPRSIQLAGVTLVAALKHAVTLQLIKYNPARGITKPKVPPGEKQVWDASQVAKVFAAARLDRLGPMYVVALSAGLRQGELFGLQWSDIDFDGRCLTVNRSLEELNGKLRTKDPKSGKRRRVDLPRFALDALRDHRAAMLAEGYIGGPVFCDVDGGWLRKSNATRRSFKPLIAAAKVPVIRFHDMRHTHATLLLLAGENVKVVSERLGHANITITLNTYAHVLPTMQKAAADRMQNLLG